MHLCENPGEGIFSKVLLRGQLSWKKIPRRNGIFLGLINFFFGVEFHFPHKGLRGPIFRTWGICKVRSVNFAPIPILLPIRVFEKIPVGLFLYPIPLPYPPPVSIYDHRGKRKHCLMFISTVTTNFKHLQRFPIDLKFSKTS